MTLKVLIVDDEKLARSRMRTLLGDCTAPQVQVGAEAANATQAMQLIQHEPFDAVLLDVHMPGADGIALARALQALPRRPAVVFVTAHAEHAVQAFEIEAVDYLTKPVRLERLQLALQKVQRLARRQDRPQPGAAGVLLIQDRGRTERVPLAEVLYFKAELKYITVRTAVAQLHFGRLAQRAGRAPRRTVFARAPQRAGAAPRHAGPGAPPRPEEGEGWAVRLNGVDELLAVSRRQLAAVREALRPHKNLQAGHNARCLTRTPTHPPSPANPMPRKCCCTCPWACAACRWRCLRYWPRWPP
jgi:two-component system response regulator AlgR